MHERNVCMHQLCTSWVAGKVYLECEVRSVDAEDEDPVTVSICQPCVVGV
jgi:hypothetical protein